MHQLSIIVTEMKLMTKIKKRDQKIAATNTKRAADGDANGTYDFVSSDDDEDIDEYVKPRPVVRDTRIPQMTKTED
jgi:hypothetical protein